MSDQMQGSTRERQRVNIGEPPKYDVIFHNDDFTPIDFVVFVLESIFFKSTEEATNITMEIHNGDRVVVGTYSRDIAISKKEKAVGLARENSFPLRITVQPHND